jgi:hypothetical protein
MLPGGNQIDFLVRQPITQMVDETAKILGFDKPAIKKLSRKIIL